MDAVEKQQELARLIENLKSGNKKVVSEAIARLRENGWLVDGSLREADLSGADLSGADLNGADLNGADLGGVNLSRANLSRANLSWTNLIVANLSGVNLSGVNLSNCGVYLTVFGDVDLSETIGLETIKHWGPSTVGIDTLFKSKGKIPEVFLRGGGVPDIFIEYMASLTGKAIEFYSCFISYSHADKDFAQLLYDRLQGQGVRCWLDEHDLKVGKFVMDEIDRAIRQRDMTIVCCSETALASGWVDREMKIVFQEEEVLFARGKRAVSKLIPLYLDRTIFEVASPVAGQIRMRAMEDCTNWKNHDAFDKSLKRIIAALKAEGDK